MKYAFMSFSTPRASFDEMLATAARLGYAGVEPRVDSKHAHGVETTADAATRRRLRESAERAGVAIACIATSCRFADPAAAADGVDTCRRAIDLAGDVGCARLRVFGGAVPDGVSREAAAERVVTSLRSLGDRAAARGVVICVETHDAWCEPERVADVMRRVDHPAIGVNWDVMHTLRQGGEQPEAAFELLRPWVKHVHVHDGVNALDKLVLRPMGSGDFDHMRVLRLLEGAGYDGFVSGEWIEGCMAPEFFRDHLETEIAALRALEAAA